MKVANKTKRFTSDRLKTITFLICLVSITLFSGCTDWKKKYESQLAVSKNLEGLLLRERSEKSQIAAQSQKTIDDLQRQIAELNRSPAEATGFGAGYDVKFDTITITAAASLRAEKPVTPSVITLNQDGTLTEIP